MPQKAKVASAVPGPAKADDYALQEHVALRRVVHVHVDVGARPIGRDRDMERDRTERMASGGQHGLVRHGCRGFDLGNPGVLGDANRQPGGLDTPRTLVSCKNSAAGHGRASIPALAGAPLSGSVGRGLSR